MSGKKLSPNELLKQILQIAQELVSCDPDKFDASDAFGTIHVAQEMAKSVLDLNDWIHKGGTLPAHWQQKEDIKAALRRSAEAIQAITELMFDKGTNEANNDRQQGDVNASEEE